LGYRLPKISLPAIIYPNLSKVIENGRKAFAGATG
jgi:hypothetical protein